MKILYIPTHIYDPFGPNGTFRACHGDINRDYGLCRGFLDLGCEVDSVVNEPKFNFAAFNLLSPEQIDYARYDAILICQTTAYEALEKRSDVAALKRHPNVGLQMDQIPHHFYGGPALSAIARIGSSLSPMMTETIRQQYPKIKMVCIPWGCPKIDIAHYASYLTPGERPYDGTPNRHQRIFFSGVISSKRHVDLLNFLVGEGFEIWIAALFHGNVTGRSVISGLSDGERKALFPTNRIHFLSDSIQREWPDQAYPHGPIPFGSFWPWLTNSSCALNFCYDLMIENQRRSIFSVHTKIYDYLAAGTRVVTEDGFPNTGDVLWYSAGQVVPWNDPKRFRDAVSEEMGTVQDSAKMAEIFQRDNNWDIRAKQWIDLLEEK